MERRSVSAHKEHFQTVLRNAEKDSKLVILNADETPGTKVGDNFLSVVLRTKIKGQRGNGKPYSGTFMTKYFPRHRFYAEVMRNDQVFLNEAHTYNKILPHFGDIGPRCVFADENEIIMEDLKDLGYIVKPRLNLLDHEHCIAIVKKLATLHARSLNLKLINPELFSELMSPLVEAIFPLDDKPCMGTSLEMSLKTAIKHLESIDQSEDVIKGVAFLKSFQDKTFSIMKDFVRPGQSKYDVMCHGDPWINNFLFKHDEKGHVTDVKLIDFQIVRHVSPAIDFHYFVYSSASSKVIENNYDDLVENYHKTLLDELVKLNVKQEHIKNLSLEWFKAELKKCSLYGLFTSFWLVNAILAEEDDVFNMDSITKEQFEQMSAYEPPIRALKAERIKSLVHSFIKRYK